MQRMFLASITIALAAVGAPVAVHAQGQQPTFATTKVTDNVYYFRYQGHQSMFIVTSAGVIATDPISENRPAAEAYLAEIRKITQAPIRYVVYSHHDPDQIAGGKPFKDAGATFVAHRFAKGNIAQMKRADIVPVDEIVEDKRTLSLGGTDLELTYLGRNHTEDMLLMRQRTRSICRNTHPGRITIATCRAISSAIAPTGQPASSIAGHIGAALFKSAGPIVIRAAGIRAQ